MSLPNELLPVGLLGTGAAGGYQIERSLRFNSADSAYLSRTPASAGNRKTWTLSFWVKRGALSAGTQQNIFTVGAAGNDAGIYFTGIDSIECYYYAGAYVYQKATSQVFRDVSAWYHIVHVLDTDNSTAEDRASLYINGVRVTQWSASTNPSLGLSTGLINSANSHAISSLSGSSRFFNGYLADIHFIDGQALDPTSFGEFDTNGIWQPKAYRGTYGTNGFHLPFSDNSTAAALGTDTSGNGNDWTVNNLQVGTTQAQVSWTSRTSVTSGELWSWSYVGLIYNGNLSDFSHGKASVTYAFSVSPVVTSSLRVLIGANWGFDANVRVRVYVNNVLYENFDPQFDWRTISFTSGSISSIRIESYNSANSQALETFLGGIEVDGVILLDYSDTQNDSLVDSPTNGSQTDTGVGGEVVGNYCTWNPVSPTSVVLTNGNLDARAASTVGDWPVLGTIAIPTSGKWYWEISLASFSGLYVSYTGMVSIFSSSVNCYVGTNNASGEAGIYKNNSKVQSPGLWSSTGDVLGIAYNADSLSIQFYKNGATYGSAVTVDSATYVPRSLVINQNGTPASIVANFGQRPFAYTAPSGYKALCTTNLPEPTIADGSTVMDVALYTGNGSTQTISGLGFSPDLVWIKSRVGTVNHVLTDSVRGAALKLASNTTGAEAGTDNGYLSAFTSDGFTVAQGGGLYPGIETNYNPGTPYTYAAWCWDAGSSTATNEDGTITSQVRANPSAGFSVLTYTGNGVGGATVGHGLGVAPVLIILKRRDSSQNWVVYTSAVDGSWDYLFLNLTNAKGNAAEAAPTSSVFSLSSGADMNANGSSHVGYCFAPVAGYSAFGSYTGNGSADGPLVYTGFRPRWLMIKSTAGNAGTDYWFVWDTARATFNPMDAHLYPNSSLAEQAPGTANYDALSNGFKVRSTFAGLNTNAQTYIFAAFAESPFSLARAR